MRLILLLSVFSCILHANSIEPRAQTFEFSLEWMSRIYQQEAWDTLGTGDISYLLIGEYYRYPNFLQYDFKRVRAIEEYTSDGDFKFTFKMPRVYTFEYSEEKEGAFYVFGARNLDTPGLEIEIEPTETIAENIRKRSLAEVWKTTLVTSFTGKIKTEDRKKGLIHVKIPLPLGPLEKILGKGEETSIDISGRESISFSGESRRVHPFVGVEGQRKQSLFPSLEMKQELDIRLKGQIGEKVNVQVDHSSSQYGDNQNKIRLNYVGFEDDVIQLIELGNTSLSLPGSGGGGFSAASKGLFGIKMLAQMGPVDLTVIASKQEGKTSSSSFTPTGGAIGQIETRRIADINYIDNKYFFLDSPLPNEPFFKPKVGEIEVFQSIADAERTTERHGRAFVDSTGRGTPIAAAHALWLAGQEVPSHEEGYFKLLEFGRDYTYVLAVEDESVLGIELIRSIENDRVLAVRYINENNDVIGNYEQFPTSPPDTSLFLELIKPRSPRPADQFGYTWNFMIRNIYSLQMSDIDATTLEIEIEDTSNRQIKSIPEGEDVPYLRIFGLDRYDESGFAGADGRIDLTTGLIDLQRGILTFPTLRAFDPDTSLVRKWTKDDTSFVVEDDFPGMENPRLYDDWLSPTEAANVHKYDIVVRAASTTRSFRVDAFNIIDGSEKVTLDGRHLTRNVDYTIDYTTGEVELKGDVVNELTPSSQINVDYEYKPLGGGASSSLIGFNSLWNISSTSRLGTTWLYQSQSSGSPRPRLGEEPTRGVVGNVYGNVQFQSDLLTDAVNLLPLVDTDTKSTLQVSGEFAASFPDPNTNGEVFIDDMEGAEDSDVISLIRRSWWWASPPVDPTDLGAFDTKPDTLRGKFFWYNIEPNIGVHRRDLNPNLNERESSLVTSLDIEFDTIDSTSWGGVMTGFPGGGLDLSKGQFIEIWVNDFKQEESDRGGTLFIELGSIDEDFFEPGENKFDTEDSNRDGFSAGTEDTGLDGFSNEQGDGTADDYDPTRLPPELGINGRYLKINGTENNQLLDTEDLDRSGQMETRNSYFRYKLQLDDSAEVDIFRDFPDYDGFKDSGHEDDAWRLYRIDMADAEIVDVHGRPTLDQVRHMRIWFDSVYVVLNPKVKRLQLAAMKIVGNRWEEDGVRDLDENLVVDAGMTDFALGVINTKTEPIKYEPPIVPAEQNEILEKEQSLLLEYSNLGPETSFRIRKRFPGTGQNYTSYRDFNFWVHSNVLDDSLEFFFKIAYDSLNFYEVTAPLTPKYFHSSGWMRVFVSLNDLTGLKFLPPDSVVSGRTYVTGSARDLLEPDQIYTTRLVGKPDLFKVRFLYMGLRNTSSDSSHVFSDELWVNDIYLGNVKRDIDYASNVSGNINMGNIIKFNTSWRRTGPDYRGLQQRRGSGSLSQSLTFGLRTNVEHFIPLFGFSVPISGNYGKNTNYPKFTPNSDTEIESKEMQDSLRTESSTRGFSASLSRRGSKNPLLKYTFDKITANFSMSQSRRRSPSNADTSTTMNGTFDYQMTWRRDRDIRIFKKYKIRYWLNSVKYRVNATRTTARRYKFTGERFVKYPDQWSAAFGQSGSVTYIPFPSLTSSFNMSVKRDLRIPHKFLNIDIGTEVKRNQSLRLGYKPPKIWILKELAPDFQYTAGYNEDSSPNIRKSGDPSGVRNVSGNRTISAKTRLDIGGFFNKLFTKLHLQEKKKVDKPKAPSPPSRGNSALPDTSAARPATVEASSASQTDTTVTEAKKRDPLVAFRKLGGILSRIRKINVSVQQRASNNYSRIPARPSLKYQLGLTKDSGVRFRGTGYDEPEKYAKNLTINLDSGTQITENIDVAAKYSTTISSTVFRAKENESRTVNWPDLSFSWKGLETFGPLRNIVDMASANFSIRKSRQESGRKGKVDAKNENLTMNPSITAGWANGLNASIAVTLTKRTSDSHGSKNENSTLAVSLDLKKSFMGSKGFRLPIPFFSKRLKFKSRLDTSLNASYSRAGGKRYILGTERFEELPGTTSIKVSPRMTYNFSSSLNGSFFIDYGRSFSDATNQTTTTIRVGINTVLTF